MSEPNIYHFFGANYYENSYLKYAHQLLDMIVTDLTSAGVQVNPTSYNTIRGNPESSIDTDEGFGLSNIEHLIAPIVKNGPNYIESFSVNTPSYMPEPGDDLNIVSARFIIPAKAVLEVTGHRRVHDQYYPVNNILVKQDYTDWLEYDSVRDFAAAYLNHIKDAVYAATQVEAQKLKLVGKVKASQDAIAAAEKADKARLARNRKARLMRKLTRRQ